jgi:hypothetical protein
MRSSPFAAFAFFVLAGFSGGGCGSSASDPAVPSPEVDSGPPAETGSEVAPPPDGCTELALGAVRAGISGGGGGSVVATPSSALGGSAADVLSIELLSAAGSSFTKGDSDLSKESDYGKCQHCVALYVDGNDAGTSASMFFQESGTMTLTEIGNPPTSQSKGSLRDVKLVEVEVDKKTFHTTKIEGGKCWFIRALSWNTVVPKGGTCALAGDCIDTTTDVCDPKTGTCVAGQCSVDALACPDGQACVFQARGTKVGACYPTCTPFGAGCSADAECVISKFDGTTGYCKKRGTTGADAACARSDLTTSCGAGYLCDSLDLKCRKQCDFWSIAGSSSVTCGAGQQCVPPGVCTDDAHDTAKIGEACGAGAKNGDGCGVIGTNLAGVCTGTPLKCAKWCRMKGSDCASGQSCQATGIASIGYCG